MTGHRFDPSILREYDVRGVVGQTLSATDAEALGRAFGSIVRGQGGTRVALGYDGRISSPELEEAVAKGLRACGITPLRIGRGPTPLLYFAVYELDADGGIMVTGSHNPPDHNGFKIMLGKASFFGEQIQELGRLARVRPPAPALRHGLVCFLRALPRLGHLRKRAGCGMCGARAV